jgi:hypothetical protein
MSFQCINNYYSTNVLGGIDRAVGTRGTLAFQGGPNSSARDFPGTLVCLLVGAAPPVVNGMLAPYFVGRGYESGSTLQNAVHMTYDPTLGLKPCAYEKTDLTGLPAQKANLTTAQTMTGDKEVWALKTAVSIAQSNGLWTLTIGSGGLLCNGTCTIQPAVRFGGDGTGEALVYVNAGFCGTMAGPIVTSGGLTKFGDGILALPSASPSFSGPIWVQGGTVSLSHPDALGTGAEPIHLQSGARLDVACPWTLTRPVSGLGAISTTSNTLVIAAEGSLSPGFGEIGTLQVEDVDFRGTYNWKYREAGADLIKAVNLTFGGTLTVRAVWVGAGRAAEGQYTLFTYAGADPVLGAWVVQAPLGRQGALSVDAANKRVLLTLTLSKSAGALVTIE